MKKFIALLIAAAMVCCLVAVPASAEAMVTFTAGTVNDVEPGQTVSIPVSITSTEAYEAHVLRLHVLYNPEYVTVTGMTPGEVWNAMPMDATKIADYTTLSGDVALGFLCVTTGVTATGTFVNINFKVKDNCTENQPISLSVEEFTYSPLSGGITNIPFTLVPGAINLKTSEPEPTEPPVQPTEPPVQPTEPPVQPTEPPVEPTEPAEMSANFTVTPKTVAADGSTITVQLAVTGNFDAHTLNLTLDYDTAALTFVSAAPGAALQAAPMDAAVIIDGETIPGSVCLGILCPTEGFTQNGVLLEITFKVADDFKANYPDGTPLTINVSEFDNMPVGAINGVVIPNGSNGGVVIPTTGAISLIGLGILAVASGAGVVLFRKKED